MEITVFKFGGASVNSAAGVKNVATILKKYSSHHLCVVVSAMGKTTNALEVILNHYMNHDPLSLVDAFNALRIFHFSIMEELFPDPSHEVYGEVDSFFNQLRGYLRKGHLYTNRPLEYDHEYDQVVSFGELISASILHHYLCLEQVGSHLMDVRELIKTDSAFRDARVDWQVTRELILNRVSDSFFQKPEGTVVLTQGFIGSNGVGETTTLGREGSDYTAAIFAWCLAAKEMTIWKDVPGVMNADPKWMTDTVCLDTLSYREAIELAYYGASIIHPKTIKPLENANIVLHVRSFAHPGLPGTTIQNIRDWEITTPIFIRKQNQILISVSPRDFSFILEENLSEIFSILARFKVKVNIMHNSAISFSICVDYDKQKINPLLKYLQQDYETRYNKGVELFTIRHYSNDAIDKIADGRKILMELRSRQTIQLVMEA